jgi:cyanophycin synthetase
VNVPLTFAGKAIFMIQNILPVVMASYLRGFGIEDIKAALETFIPSHAQTPGRMNVFNFQKFTVIIDYAHNPAGLQALGKFLEKVDDSPKVGIITGVGDRRDEDIKALGSISAGIFDEIIIRQDKHLRGRQDTDIVELLEQGIREVNATIPVKVIFKEVEAIEYAIKNAIPGSFIVVCSDVVAQAVDAVMRLREEEAKVVIRHEDIPNIR